jgi:hypothetical protein
MRFTLFLLLLFLPIIKAEAAPQLRGLRVDPSYFYELYADHSAADIARKVLDEAQAAHVNTLYLYAYNSQNGAFYQTDYPMTEVEFHLGRQNIFSEIYNLALQRGLKVIACLSVFDFKVVWQQQPEWRSKLIDGTDYKPFAHAYLLSTWHPEFRNWFRGFISDLAVRYPKLYAIEAIEPTVDAFWLKQADFNPLANQEFFRQYPQGKLGDSNWKKVRAQGVTQLLAIMAEEAHRLNLSAGVVQTWPAKPNADLYSNDEVRDRIGYNLDEILSLQGNQKMDFVMGEFLWQQWAAEYGNVLFTPEWTRRVAHEFIQFVNMRSQPIIHVEISSWQGEQSTVTPTDAEFYQTLLAIKDFAEGIDVYDHSQIESREAWDELSIWNQ